MLKDVSKKRIEVLKMLLRPAALACVRTSLTIQDLFQAVKEVLVEVAIKEMERKNEKVNISRISVMTGVHRRDVMRIHEEGDKFESSISLAARVIAHWEQDRRFRGKNGLPKSLGIKGQDSEFRKLVHTVSKEINPGTVLFELVRSGFVEKWKDKVTLRDLSHVLKDQTEGYTLLQRDTEDLVSCVVENLEKGPETLNLHARTEYNNLYLDDLPKIKKWLLDEGTVFHKKVRDYLAKFDKDINPKPSKQGGGKALVIALSRTLDPAQVEEEKDERI